MKETNTDIAVKLFNEQAGAYANKFMDVSSYHESLQALCQLIDKVTARVLDCACGPGNITHYLLEQLPHLQILGTDLAPEMLEIARINNPKAEFKQMDSREVNSLAMTFDAVILSFILPYLNKEEVDKLLIASLEKMNPSGLLYISTMEGDYSNSGYEQGSNKDWPQIYMHYYSDALLTDLLNKVGFDVIQTFKVAQENPSPKSQNDIILIAKSNKKTWNGSR